MQGLQYVVRRSPMLTLHLPPPPPPPAILSDATSAHHARAAAAASASGKPQPIKPSDLGDAYIDQAVFSSTTTKDWGDEEPDPLSAPKPAAARAAEAAQGGGGGVIKPGTLVGNNSSKVAAAVPDIQGATRATLVAAMRALWIRVVE